MKNKIAAIPLTKAEKEKKEQEFINKADTRYGRGKNKIKRRALFLNVPESLFDDIERLAMLEERQKVDICVEILKREVGERLKAYE